MSKLSRRTFLKSSSATIVLPLLDANVAAIPKSYRSSAIPKRLVFIPMGYGVVSSAWFPSTKDTGSDYELPTSLKPFEDVKSDISVIQNLTNRHSAGAHAATANFLTSANVKGEGGKFVNTISCDQLAAEKIGQGTRHSSLSIGGRLDKNDGHGGGKGYASWNKEGQPVGTHRTLTSLYTALFGTNNKSDKLIRAELARKKSSLDALTYNAKRLNRKISTEDRDRVDEYFTTIRSVEKQLSKATEWLSDPFPEANFDLPEGSFDGREEMQLNFDMMHLALQSDSTRVMTYLLPTRPILQHLGSRLNSHFLSHMGPKGTSRHEVYLKRDRTFSEMVSGFVKKLKETKEHDGSNLLDHSLIAYGTSLRQVHNMKNGPMILAGHGGGGIQQGQNYVFKENVTPFANLWLSMIRHVGVDQDSFGDSTGVLKEIGFK